MGGLTSTTLPPLARSRADYDAAATLRGANFVGSPEQVAEKILFQHAIFGHDRFLVQLMRSIELLGTAVAPVVRTEIPRRIAATGAEA